MESKVQSFQVQLKLSNDQVKIVMTYETLCKLHGNHCHREEEEKKRNKTIRMYYQEINKPQRKITNKGEGRNDF